MDTEEKTAEELEREWIAKKLEATKKIGKRGSAFERITCVQLQAANIQYMDNPTETENVAAVLSDANAIKHIPSPSETVQMLAIDYDWNLICLLYNPSPKVQMLAVEQDYHALLLISSPSQEAISYLKEEIDYEEDYDRDPLEQQRILFHITKNKQTEQQGG